VFKVAWAQKLVILLTPILLAACGGLVQQDIRGHDPALADGPGGMIVGSVTAPFASQYHHGVLFRYRSLGDSGGVRGILTSATSQHYVPFWPSCEEDGLPRQCGRLFAVALPEGEYEIHEVTIVSGGSGHSVSIPAWGFSVSRGEVSYLGNLNMQYCQGLVRRFRGGILGGDITVRDEYQRDIELLESKFGQLAVARVQKRLLPDIAASWRVTYQPFDWGTCAVAQAGPSGPGFRPGSDQASVRDP